MARAVSAEEPVTKALVRLVRGIAGPGASWRKGAEGEERVAAKLARLPRDRWMVLHDLPLGPDGRNLDHLVIGPGGVFTVNTKNLGSSVWVRDDGFYVGGRWREHLKVARSEAKQTHHRLSGEVGQAIDVSAVVVVLCPKLTVVRQPEDVVVLGEGEVPGWFEARPKVLDAATASRAYFASRRGTVWTRRWDDRRRRR